MDKSKIIINHPQGDFTLESIQKDVDVAKIKFGKYNFCFTVPTVQSLIDKIIEQEQIIQGVKDTVDNFFNEVTSAQFEKRANETTIEDGY